MQQLSTETVRNMHATFMAQIENKVMNALPQTPQMNKALTVLLLEAARKDIPLKLDELKALAAGGMKLIQKKMAALEKSLHTHLADSFRFPSPHFSRLQKLRMAFAAACRRDGLNDTFDGKDRLYFRFNEDIPMVSKTQWAVENFINRLGYRILDYKNGYAAKFEDKEGKQPVKIGRLLKTYPSLQKTFAEDSTRTLGKLIIVLSRNVDDIARMSTGRAWGSCIGSGGVYYKYIPRDIKGGTLAAYLVSENDPKILNPIARIALRPFVNKSTKEVVFIPGSSYGLRNDTFVKTVYRIARTLLNPGKNGDFKIKRRLYKDGGIEKFTLQDGYTIITHPSGEYKEWYLDGELHREGGPAREYVFGGMQVWFQHGQCHREDGPAITYANGRQEWYLNGKEISKAAFQKRLQAGR